jgi:CDP-diacylglycerol--serine O-phosphatidyltransferase
MGEPVYAAICLLTSGLCDLFDGRIARTKKDRTDDEKKFGIQIDSLTDLICFGVLPSCMGYAFGMNKWYFFPILIYFVVFGLIRLAYFNALEGNRQEVEKEGANKFYWGMPITMSSLIMPFTVVFYYLFENAFVYIYASVLALVGILFVVKIKIPKPHKAGAIILAIVSTLIVAATVVLIILKANGKI